MEWTPNNARRRATSHATIRTFLLLRSGTTHALHTTAKNVGPVIKTSLVSASLASKELRREATPRKTQTPAASLRRATMTQSEDKGVRTLDCGELSGRPAAI